MRKITLWGTSFGKIGDEAQLWATTRLVKSLRQDTDLALISRPRAAARRQYPHVNQIGLRNLPMSLGRIARSNLLIIVGAPFFETRMQAFGCFLVFLTAALFRTPAMAYGITVFDLKTRWGQWFYRRMLNRLRLIAVRERGGLEALQRLGVTAPARLIADTRSALTEESQESIDESLRGIGFDPDVPFVAVTTRYMDENVPDWVKRDHSYTAENVKQVGEALSRAVDRLSANAQIVVLPMHPRADQDEAMLKVMQQFMSRPEQAKLLPRGLGARATIELLGRAELVISSRLGSTVFALGQATPTVALAYESRQLEVMQRAGQPDCAIDWKQLEGNRFVSICENAWQMRAPMRKQLQFHAAASSRQVQMDAALLLTPFLFNEPLESATASV